MASDPDNCPQYDPECQQHSSQQKPSPWPRPKPNAKREAKPDVTVEWLSIQLRIREVPGYRISNLIFLLSRI